jgi:hypothetical protein
MDSVGQVKRADVSCSLLEFDFSGIEAVLTGWCLWRHGFSAEGAKQYIRLARLGMHAAVTALKLGQPVDLSQPDEVVKPQLDQVKTAHLKTYDTSKRTVHANNFGMTIYGMCEKFPEFFPTLKAAEEFQSYYYALAPDLPKWHHALRTRAREHGALGGFPTPGAPPSIWDHPYGYRHWFWDVLSYQPVNEYTARKWLGDPARAHRIVYLHGRPFRVSLGGDGNRVVAFYPQSIASGRLKEAELELFLTPEVPDYIGDAYFGQTPFLGPIHDSLLLHVPNRCVDKVTEIVARVMQRPSSFLPIPEPWGWGTHLAIGVDAKIGKTWADMEKIAIPAPTVWAGADPPVLPREGEGDVLDWRQLARRVA